MENSGWTGNPDADSALVMLGRLDIVDPDDDARIEAIEQIIRKMAVDLQLAQASTGSWTNAQCLEFISVAFRHNEIIGEVYFDDIRLGVKFALEAAPKQEK